MEDGNNLNLVGAPTVIVGAVFLTIAVGVRRIKTSAHIGNKPLIHIGRGVCELF